VNVRSVTRLWSSVGYGHGQIVLLGDLLLVAAEHGEIILLAPAPEAPGKTHPLLMRTAQEVACLRLPLVRQP
jgi:hypothetical protein